MSKSIVVCSDGTWDGAHGGPASNVLKLFNALDGNLTLGAPDAPEQERRFEDGAEGVTQAAKYIHGVGDSGNWLDELLGGSMGMGLLSRVLRGYTFISRNYIPGDKIFLVGFSRGAYTARALGELISEMGLLDWETLNLNKGDPDKRAYNHAAVAWCDCQKRRLQNTTSSPRRGIESFIADLGELLPVQEVRPQYVPNVPIEAIGVWDTVGSLGIPVLSADHEMRLDPLRLADTSLPANIRHGFHAVAADEQRIDFTPTLWDPDPRVVQRFFPGSHGDVGGGFPEGEDSQLSDLALAWMADQLKSVGVRFANDPPFPSKGSALGRMHMPWTAPPYDTRPAEPREFPACAAQGSAITVDESVRQRIGQTVSTITGTVPPVTHKGPYVPVALVNSGHLDVSGVSAKNGHAEKPVSAPRPATSPRSQSEPDSPTRLGPRPMSPTPPAAPSDERALRADKEARPPGRVTAAPSRPPAVPASASQGSTIIQIVGDGNTMLPGSSATPAERRLPQPSSPPPPRGSRTLFGLFRPRRTRSASEAPDPSARYTNIRILDSESAQTAVPMTHALRARHAYALEVSIKVKRDPDAVNAGREDQPPLEIKDQQETVWVWVVLTDETEGDDAVEGNLFKLDRRYGALRLPVTGDSEGALSFQFTAMPPRGVLLDRSRREIAPRIGIRIYHKLNLIDHTQLDLRFTEKKTPVRLRKRDPAIRVKFMQVDNRPMEVPDPASAARALTISISKPDPEATHYRFALAAGSRANFEEPALFASRKLSERELDGFVADFRDILLKAVFERSLAKVDLSTADQETLLAELAELGDRMGASLFNYSREGDLFELSQMLREVLPEVSIIQIALGAGAQELVLPWQILTLTPSTDPDVPIDPRNLWGYRFVIEVKRCGDGVDPRPRPDRKRASARVTYARWSFENESSHYTRLQEIVGKSTFPASITEPILESRGPFASALLNGGGELLYVYAHGHAAAPNTASGIRYRTAARTRMSELSRKLERTKGLASSELENLRRVQEQFLKLTRSNGGSSLSLNKSNVELTYLLTQSSKARARLTDAPIIFLNTCESAQIWNALSDSFVAFFLDRGARAVLGTESTIPIVVADVFGQAVLESLFQGNTLGQALHAARWKLLKEHCNPLGLCYCLYGAADSRVSPV
jgi:uncharacterized protein (DUF2235 family)